MTPSPTIPFVAANVLKQSFAFTASEAVRMPANAHGIDSTTVRDDVRTPSTSQRVMRASNHRAKFRRRWYAGLVVDTTDSYHRSRVVIVVDRYRDTNRRNLVLLVWKRDDRRDLGRRRCNDGSGSSPLLLHVCWRCIIRAHWAESTGRLRWLPISSRSSSTSRREC